MSRITGCLTLIFTAFVISACSFSLNADITPPPGSVLSVVPKSTQSMGASPFFPIIPPNLASGAKIYNQQCSQCHGPKGLGDGPKAAQLSVPVATLGLSKFSLQSTIADWFAVVTHGNMEKFMPAFTNLSDRQRWDVVAYAMSLSAPDTLITTGKTLYQQNCVRCHGRNGKGDGAAASNLTVRPNDFTNQAFMAQTSSDNLYQAITKGIAPDMPAFTSTIDESGRLALAAYLRSFTFIYTQASSSPYPSPASKGSTISSNNAARARQSYPGPIETQTAQLGNTTEASPAAPFIGSVTVQVANGSGGNPPAYAPVTLYGFDNMQNTFSETLTTGVNGISTFTNIVMPPGRAFMAGVEYASATYGSDIVKVNPANPDLNLQITVYEPSSDISVLTTDRVHVLLDFTTPGMVNVVEVFVISNPSNQAIVAPIKHGTVVTFPLPQGYSNLQFQDGGLGGRYVQVSQGFGDTSAVNPGEGQYQVIFAFQLPYNHKLDFVQPMFLPTSAVVILVPDNGVKVDSSMLQNGNTQNYQNITYRTYNGNNLAAGSTLNFNLSGDPKYPAKAFISSGNMQNLVIGLSAFAGMLIFGGIWLFRVNQRRALAESSLNSAEVGDSYNGNADSSEDEDTLMDAIIALDDQFQNGHLPKEAYLERRAILKDKLRNLRQG